MMFGALINLLQTLHRKKYQLSLMVTATFLRLKMEQQLKKLRLHHCSQINKKTDTVSMHKSKAVIQFAF